MSSRGSRVIDDIRNRSRLFAKAMGHPSANAAAMMTSVTPSKLQDLEAWKREEGYWFGELTFLNEEGRYDYIASDTPTSGQFDYRTYFGFINLQVDKGELKQRNIFVRPPLNIEPFDLNADKTVSADELHLFGFSSPFGYRIDTESKTATPLNEEIRPFLYNEGTEQTFSADQSASDTHGTLIGSYFGIPTTTQTLGDNTIVYTVGSEITGLFQNQLTTLPDRNGRVRTAQGFGGGQPTYASFYRETKVLPSVDSKGYVTRSARDNFLELLAKHRSNANVPDSLITKNTTAFFTTGLEKADTRGVAIPELELSLDAAIRAETTNQKRLKGTKADDIFALTGNKLKVSGKDGINTYVITGFERGNKADVIKDFNPAKGDRVVLGADAISANPHNSLTFAVAANASEFKALKKDASVVIYRENKGDMIFDANGAERGLGDGGRFLKLMNAPELFVDSLFSLMQE